MFKLSQAPSVEEKLIAMEADAGLAIQLKAVRKTIGLLQAHGPSYPSLKVHKYKGEVCPHGDALFQAYAQNNIPGAYRVFFCYVPGEEKHILIVAIESHP